MNTPIDTSITKSFGATASQYTADAAIKIDWYNFETRMRSLIKDIVDPVQDFQTDNQHSITEIIHSQEKMNDQIQELEYQTTKVAFNLVKL